MSKQLLINPEINPSDDVLKQECGSYFPTLKTFLNTLSAEPFMLTPGWRFYKDGKAWLCKICYKKKTAAWMSVWKGHFKVALYFTDKPGAGIPNLDIDESLKEGYKNARPIGKLRPMVAEINKKSQLEDVYSLIKYKLKQLIMKI